MNAQKNIMDNVALHRYNEVMRDIIQVAFPSLTLKDIDEVIRYSANKRYKQEMCSINNNYTKRKAELSLVDLTNYILEREPIITAWGVLWKRKGTVPNPLIDMIKGFMINRGILKNKMFEYPKGSEEFEKYNLLQL